MSVCNFVLSIGTELWVDWLVLVIIELITMNDYPFLMAYILNWFMSMTMCFASYMSITCIVVDVLRVPIDGRVALSDHERWQVILINEFVNCNFE